MAKINIIGSGNVAWHISNALTNTDFKVQQICSRNLASAKQMANTFGYEAVNTIKDFKLADAIILAVDDDEIGNVSKQLSNISDTVVVHTSGSVSIDTLLPHENRAVLWLIESLTKGEKVNYYKIPAIVHYSNAYSNNLVYEIAKSISNVVHILADKERRALHLGAVMANNFTNHLFTLLQNFTASNNIDFSLLHPIINSTFQNAQQKDPHVIQTGPAIRHDKATIDYHLEILKQHPQLKEIYTTFTNSIQSTHKA